MKKFLTIFVLLCIYLMPGVSGALDYSKVAFQYWGGEDEFMIDEINLIIDGVNRMATPNSEGISAWKNLQSQMEESREQYGVVTITNEQLAKACKGLFNLEFDAEKRGAGHVGPSFNEKCNWLKDNFQTMWENGVYRRGRALKNNAALCKAAGCEDINNRGCKVTITKSKNGDFDDYVDCEDKNTCVTNSNHNEHTINEGAVICKGRIKWYDKNLQEIKSEEKCKNVLINNFLKYERKFGYISNLERVGVRFSFNKREMTCSGNDMCVMNIPYTDRDRGEGYYSMCLKVDLSKCDDLMADLFVGNEVINFKQTTGGELTLQECKEAQK